MHATCWKWTWRIVQELGCLAFTPVNWIGRKLNDMIKSKVACVSENYQVITFFIFFRFLPRISSIISWANILFLPNKVVNIGRISCLLLNALDGVSVTIKRLGLVCNAGKFILRWAVVQWHFRWMNDLWLLGSGVWSVCRERYLSFCYGT